MSETTILIVEDEAIIAADLSSKLQQLGYNVVGMATEGEEAIEVTSRLHPDLVLMDIRLEGTMDGIEAAEEIKLRHDAPVIYLTAHSDAATLSRAKLTGPCGYVLKPFDERDLAAQIELGLYKHQAERQLREQREWLRVTLTSIGDAVIATDSEGLITFLNPVAASLTGWNAEEAMGQPLTSVFQVVNEKTGKPQEEIVARVLREGHAVGLANHSALVNKEGRTVPIEDSAAPILAATGQVIGVVLVFHDVSEQRRAEEEKEHLQAQLNQAQKMEAVGRLAGGVAHDFNNQLGIILGKAQMAIMKLGPQGPVSRELDEIVKASRRSADLVRQLLAFARKQTVTPRVSNLNDIVEGTFKMLRRLIGENIDLAWKPGPHVWTVKVDPSQVDQVLANLAVNARDAINGVGKVTIETSNVVLDEAYCSDHQGAVPGEFVLLSVTDNGTGMVPEVLEHLFEPFFTTKEVGKGTGLGLSSVYGIVKQNNGFIDVQSEPGRGTAFKIYLPRFEPHPTETEVEEKREALKRGTETVLIVEDEPAILRIGKAMLESLGYSVLAAKSPQEAIRLAREHAGEIDLLLTDVVMPEMDGRALVGKLKSLYPSLRCLYMSGYTANVIAHHGVLDEGLNFIQKPFSMRDLAPKVRQALDRQ